MYLRVAKAKFAELTKRYKRGSYEEVTRDIDTDLPIPESSPTQGVAVGLDGSYNRDYKITPASDPLIIIHGKHTTTHEELQKQLDHLGIWNNRLSPIELPRKTADGEYTWAPGFKSLPNDSNFFEHYKEKVEQKSDGMCLTSQSDVEVTVPDIQQRLTQFK